MKEITILEIILVTILLLMPIVAGYFAWRTFRLKKSVELLRIDRNELIEERNKLKLWGIKDPGTLSKPERKLIIAALNMPEYGDAIKDPKTSFQMRKIYRDLREKLKDSLKD